MCSTRQRLLSLLILPVSLLFAGCSVKERVRHFLRGEERSTVAVRVGGKAYTNTDLQRFFESRLSEFRDPANADRVKSNLLDSFIEDRLLLCQAERLKIQPDKRRMAEMLEKMSDSGIESAGRSPEGDAELELSLTESLKMQQYLHNYVLKDITVSDEDCEAYYKEHLGEYVENDVAHVREILVEEPEQAERILVLLKAQKNKNFADLARIYSKGSSAPEGGDLGFFRRGELPEEFDKAVFAVSSGSISKIVRTRYGFHVFLVEERILAHQQKFYEVKEAIKEKLQLERERETIERELASLINKIPVEIHRERLDFAYVGARFSSKDHK